MELKEYRTKSRRTAKYPVIGHGMNTSHNYRRKHTKAVVDEQAVTGVFAGGWNFP